MDGNVFLDGAKPSRFEEHPVVANGFRSGPQLVENPRGLYLKFKIDRAWPNEQTRKLVTGALLGKAVIPDLPYERPDGSPIRIDTDYFGKPRSDSNPTPGPFERPGTGRSDAEGLVRCERPTTFPRAEKRKCEKHAAYYRFTRQEAHCMTRIIAVCLFLLSAITTASAQTTTVWEIGKFDQSSSEFSAATADKVLYRVGTSDWSKDWPGTQKAGSKYEIDFPLESAPRGSFVFTASISPYALSRIPALHVEVNGHGGVFYLDLKSSYGSLNVRPPSETLAIEIPAGYLHKGLNSLILSCIDTRPTETAPHEVPGIRYDALSFTNDPESAKRRNAIDARVIPQIFYREKDGHLFEVVDATVQFAHPLPAGHAELNIAGKSYLTMFSATEDFGEERLEFEVPEWAGTTQGRLKVTAGKLFAFDMPLTAGRKWTIFVVPHTHVDVGFTDNQGKVAEVQARELDQAIEMIHEHPTFKFTTDGSWDVEQFLNTRPKQQQDELLNLARENKIGIPADYANLLTGYASPKRFIALSITPKVSPALTACHSHLRALPMCRRIAARILPSWPARGLSIGRLVPTLTVRLTRLFGFGKKTHRSGGKGQMERKSYSGTIAAT